MATAKPKSGDWPQLRISEPIVPGVWLGSRSTTEGFSCPAAGVGKTSFAKALAKSARVPLVATSVAEWNASDYLSGTLQAIRKIFAQAKSRAPCILFIDELDGISDRSEIRGEHVQYWTQVVNLFLELLAGVDERPGSSSSPPPTIRRGSIQP